MPFLAQIETATKFADHAAQQNDRWLLICLLVFIFAGAIWVMRWLLNRDEANGKLREERLERMSKLLEGLFKDSNEGRATAIGVISTHTAHVIECTNQMRDNTERLRKADQTIERACLLLDRMENR